MRIIGICLVQNDDRFLERALRNVLGFCDEVIITEHHSIDRTPEICRQLVLENSKVAYHRIDHPSQSQDFLDSYVNTPTWVFGIDGDEVYDPVGLSELKKQLQAGRYANKWQVMGKVLHATEFDFDRKKVKGFLARPSRPINKLYNFSLIRSWNGPCSERLHNGHITFIDPKMDRQNKDDEESWLSWDKAVFRCLHAAFVWRSSAFKCLNQARPNIEEVRQYSKLQKLVYLAKSKLGISIESKSKSPYRKGPLVEVDMTPFFPDYLDK